MDMYVVIGQGSMGKRRVRCLLANGIGPEQIIVCDHRDDRLAESAEKYGVRGVSSASGFLHGSEVKAVIISVPGAMHFQYVLAALRAGKHWFCEVPLAVKMDGLDDVIAMTSKGLVGVSGCQLLFHPLAKALRTWSQSPSTGRILGASYSYGTYLPEWHPYEDYRHFYASSAALGGGNLDVIVQEVMWIRWILNVPVVAATCRMSKVGPLKLAAGTPDHQEVILEFENGVMVSMHFDLNDRTHERWLRLTAEYSTAKWSTLDPSIKIYDAGSAQWTEQPQPENFQYETCYQEEIAQFLRCIRTCEPWPVNLSVAREMVAILQAIQVSARERRTVELQEVFNFGISA